MESRDKVLIIDDSSVQADMLRSILAKEYDVTVAHTAEAGLYHAKVGNFSLVLLDVIMPGMDGFALLRELQEEIVTRHVPVILITSLRDAENEERELVLGAVDYITKPYYPPIVRARVNTHVKLYRYRSQVERQSMVDPMTGVPNRRSYNISCHNKWQEAIRFRQPISLCMFDIDHFKSYNDTFGHPAGDKVICAVAQTATSFLRRSTDFFARYGGEEFVAILMGCDAATAAEQMQKIRKAVEDLNIPHTAGTSQWVTVSIGGVTVVPRVEDSYDTYLKLADTMLYDAKRFGRNRVVWSNSRGKEEIGGT